MTNYWIVKSEPDVYSFDTLVNDGKGVWDGVRNYQARNNLKAMKMGDLLLFYHSNIGKEIVGIATVSKEHFQDPTTTDLRWVAIEVMPMQKLAKSVPLATIKADVQIQNIQLVRHSRLSVIPLQKAEFDRILFLGGM